MNAARAGDEAIFAADKAAHSTATAAQVRQIAEEGDHDIGAGVSIVEIPPAGLILYINAIPSTPCPSLDSYVDALAERLRVGYGQGAVDIRCAPDGSPLAFGKWKGALAALAREAPPCGVYVVFTEGREIHAVVADALASKAFVVRGVRS